LIFNIFYVFLTMEFGAAELLARQTQAVRQLYSNLDIFSRSLFAKTRLRLYQLEAAQAIAEAVRAGQGGQFALLFSRQAGKDETLAQLQVFLLNLYQKQGGTIVLAAPTQRQANLSRDRLLVRLRNNLNRWHFSSSEGYQVRLEQASARFMSAAPAANPRGETASLLLIANEAQDILPSRWDAVFDPMAASTNAVTVFCGTPWTSHTLLARQLRHMRNLESQDGQRRIFLADWQRVAATNPAYGERVQARIAQFGSDHPFIRTEYCLQEIDGEGGLFPLWRRQLMQGSHVRLNQPQPGKIYCLLLDVAGGVESGDIVEDNGLAQNSRRDSTAVTVVEVGPGAGGGLPCYKVVQRYVWTGVGQTQLYERILTLTREVWKVYYVVIDSTGIGAGLASFLAKILGRKLIPYNFSAVSKSALGWGWLAAIDSGRYLEYVPDNASDTNWFWQQVAECSYEVRNGPGRLMRWSVADPNLHDDLLISASLVAALDELDWHKRSAIGLE
jgi:hypothetical protein